MKKHDRTITVAAMLGLVACQASQAGQPDRVETADVNLPAFAPTGTAAYPPGTPAGPAQEAYVTKTFDVGSLIIPMDECHQYANQTSSASMRTAPKCYCPDTVADDGILKAYGLVYRLLEQGVTVNVMIDDAKTDVEAVDLSVVGPPGVEPVKKYDRTTNLSTSFFAGACATGASNTITYRGAPFVIPAADASKALLLIKNGDADGVNPPTNTRGIFSASTFSNVEVHVAMTSFTGKVARSYNSAPPPLALLNVGGASLSVLTGYLDQAGIGSAVNPLSAGTACAPGTIYGTFDTAADFTTNDCLTVGGYKTLWAPHWIGTDNSSLDIDEYKKDGSKRKLNGDAEDNATVIIKNAYTCATLSTKTADSSGNWSDNNSNTGAWNPPPCWVAVDSGGTVVLRKYSNHTCKGPAGTSISSPPSAEPALCPSTTTGGVSEAEGIVSRIAQFADEGNAVFAECASIETFEGSFEKPASPGTCTSCGALEVLGTTDGHFQMTNGATVNYLDSSYATTSTEGFIYRRAASPFIQKGDLKLTGTSGHIKNWKPAGCATCTPGTFVHPGATPGDSDYLEHTTKLISSCAGADWNSATGKCNRSENDWGSAFTDAKSDWDIFTFRRKDGDPNKGPIFYLAGHNYAGQYGGVRLVLNTMFNLAAEVAPPETPEPRQIVRSSPILADVNGTLVFFQGAFTTYIPVPAAPTYSGSADNDSFVFPHIQGHAYAFDASAITTDATEFSALGAPLWDGATLVPPVDESAAAFNGINRTVFTNVASGTRPARVLFTTANQSAIAPLLSSTLNNADTATLMSRIKAGAIAPSSNPGDPRIPALGGIDRSGMALIEGSPYVNASRPRMLYAAGLDGMVHAFCAEIAGTYCTEPGRELWAYIPRTQLGQLRFNNGRIDGNLKVADLRGDFDGNGTSEWRTVMAFQTGSGTASSAAIAPSVVALDISNPDDPKVLWDVSTPASRGASELGVGLGVAMGTVRISGQLKPAVFVTTNNGGTGTSGMYVQAYNATTGAPLWANPFSYTYPAQRVSGSGPVPSSGIPAGPAAIDLTNTGTVTHLVVPTLYGDLFMLDATTGANVHAPNPLFRFSVDKQPIGTTPAIYQAPNGEQYAIVTSGGYVDPTAATWVDLAGTHYVVGVHLTLSPDQSPITETGINRPDRPFKVDLTGETVFAQASVLGDKLFVTSASSDVNDLSTDGTGKLRVIDLDDGSISGTYVLGSAGASSAEVIGEGVAYISGTENAIRIDTVPVGTGATVEITQDVASKRMMWLRVE